MTPAELQAIRERCSKATAVPWHWSCDPIYQGLLYGGIFGCQVVRLPHDFEMSEEDAEFIAHARTDLPKALDEIERQAIEIERLQIERDARDQRACELFDEVKVLQDALAMIRRIKSRDHNDALKRLQNIDNIACQALGGNFMTDTYTDEENERLRGALERIGWKMMNHNPMELRAIARQALKGDE